jgi:hypothetical protein
MEEISIESMSVYADIEIFFDSFDVIEGCPI